MNKKQEKMFNGFAQHSLDFLHNVREENSRTWFEKNKHNYLRYLLEPFQNLVADLSENMLAIDPYFESRPLVDKTISRIYRDTRFSKDKSLFKNRMWITFKRPIKEWKDAPAYFFELSPDSYRYGMGYYSASRNTMDKLRESINENPSEFLQAISFYGTESIFNLEGEKYKRFLPNDNPKEIQDWYQRKSFYLTCNRTIDDTLFSSELVDELILGFNILKPLYQYLLRIRNSNIL